MTSRTIDLLITKKPTTTFYLVCWPEENNKLSVVPGKKIVSPSHDDLTPGTFCKVKGLEKYKCKIVAEGTQEEMEAKMDEMEEDDATVSSPPKKTTPRDEEKGEERQRE